jgi:hypothetical protein
MITKRIMLIIPVGLTIWHILFPNDISELINLTISLPILVFITYGFGKILKRLKHLSSGRKKKKKITTGRSDQPPKIKQLLIFKQAKDGFQ